MRHPCGQSQAVAGNHIRWGAYICAFPDMVKGLAPKPTSWGTGRRPREAAGKVRS